MNETRRELHMHVGLPKTGTSSIQAALPLNRDAFAAAGFTLAPMMESFGAHHELYLLEEREGPEALATFLEGVGGERLLISSEYFSRMLRDPARLAALAAALRPRFNVKIHALVRRQDMQKESGYAQTVKVRRIGPISPERNPEAADFYGSNFYHDPDYEHVFGHVEKAFGREALSLGVFDPSRPGEALDWFLELLGIALPAPVRPSRVNESIDRRRTLFLSHMAKPPDSDLIWFVFRIVRWTRHIRDDGGRHLMSPEARHAVMESYREGNRRLVERYGIAHAGSLLTLTESHDPDWFPAEPIRLSEFFGVGASLARSALKQRNWPIIVRLWRAMRLLALTAEAALHAHRLRKAPCTSP